jgi:zinc protease
VAGWALFHLQTSLLSAEKQVKNPRGPFALFRHWPENCVDYIKRFSALRTHLRRSSICKIFQKRFLDARLRESVRRMCDESQLIGQLTRRRPASKILPHIRRSAIRSVTTRTMNDRTYDPRLNTRIFVGFVLVLAAHVGFSQIVVMARQTGPAPQREQLLNGLRTLVVHRPGDAEVFLKLRVHSGAAFDLAGKEGLMALLGDALFDSEAKAFVKDDLGGRLVVTTTYDALDVTMSGRANDFERFIDLLRNAVLNTQLSPDVVAKLRDARIKSTGATSPSAMAVADRLVALRLFGNHPYGRTVDGTAESLGRIERTDLIIVRERFMNPNNATLVVAGGVEPRRVIRLLRQNFGGWTKSDRLIPSTFRQPEPADSRTLVVNNSEGSGAEVRLAVRGLARSDRDAAASQTVAVVARDRWLKAFPALNEGKFFVRHEPRTESGIFVMGATLSNATSAARALESARQVLNELSTKPAAFAEIETAKQAASKAFLEGSGNDEWYADDLLAEYTYKTKGAARSEINHALAAVTPEEVQRVAARLFLHAPIATVAVGEAASLSVELARAGGVEVFGTASPQVAPTAQPPARMKRP